MKNTIKRTVLRWDDVKQTRTDFDYLQKLRDRLVVEIAPEMNRTHSTDFSVRCWDIVFGYWLTQFIDTLFDRWHSENNSETQYMNLDELANQVKVVSLVPNDSKHAQTQFVSDDWNFLISSYLKIAKDTNCNIRHLILDHIGFEAPRFNSEANQKIKFFSKIKKIVCLLFRFSRYSGPVYLFKSSYLSISDLLKIRFRLKGKIVVEPNFSSESDIRSNNAFRRWKIALAEQDSEFEILLKSLIPLFMPISFLEQFKDLASVDPSAISRLKKVDVVFSANSHFQDDPFKIWLARAISESKTTLVCGQHGSGPFNLMSGGWRYELNVSDFYATTGSGNFGHVNMRDVGQFFGRVKRRVSLRRSNLILVNGLMPRHIFMCRSHPMGCQMLDYFDNQFRFYEGLRPSVRDRSYVRLYPGHDYGWRVSDRWLAKFPMVKFDSSKKSLSRSIGSSKLAVFSYYGTSYHDSLAANIPTIIFFDRSVWSVASYAESALEELKDVNIFFDDPSCAAAFVSEKWSAIDQWWNNPRTQAARRAYCRLYARRDRGLAQRLASVLIEASEYDS